MERKCQKIVFVDLREVSMKFVNISRGIGLGTEVIYIINRRFNGVYCKKTVNKVIMSCT